jgi:hypothetical protein
MRAPAMDVRELLAGRRCPEYKNAAMIEWLAGGCFASELAHGLTDSVTIWLISLIDKLEKTFTSAVMRISRAFRGRPSCLLRSSLLIVLLRHKESVINWKSGDRLKIHYPLLLLVLLWIS